jgi:hypothetical protein
MMIRVARDQVPYATASAGPIVLARDDEDNEDMCKVLVE